MARWVIASRRQRTPEARRAAAKRTEEAFKKLFEGRSRVRGINRGGEDHDYFAAVFDADASDARHKKRYVPREDAILEPEILHSPASVSSHVLRVLGDGKPLAHARVTPLVTPLDGGAFDRVSSLTTITDDEGRAQLAPEGRGPDGRGSRAVLIEPASGYWSRRIRDLTAIDEIHLDPLPPGPFGWWHVLMGADRRGAAALAAARAAIAVPPQRSASSSSSSSSGWRDGDLDEEGGAPRLSAGSGASVGVIDTGCGPHAALGHVVDQGAYVNGVYSADGRDSAQHGTHLCGLIGARSCPDGPTGYVGIAPDAALHSVRVCAIGSELANQVDITLALRRLMQVPVNLVAIGLTAGEPSAILGDAIREALEVGILCVCPAGNTASRLRFPAALDDTAAVTAVGLAAWGPEHAVVRAYRPAASERARIGDLADCELYLASFSCVAPTAVTCAGPGVGIISCVPGGDAMRYAEMSGTSMAAALATGALASILSRKENYRTLPRSLERADLAHALLGLHCRTMGMDRRYQGKGVPWVAP